MHIGISRPMASHPPVADVDAALVARHAEAAGFECLLYGEHPITPLDDDETNYVHGRVPFFQETVVALARVSAVTTRLTFGFGVCLVPQHQPVRLAKQLAGLDHYSGGRLIVGVGTGWNRVETESLGGRHDRRWGQTRDYVGLWRKLWTDDRVEHHSDFLDLEPVRLFPLPARPGGPPVLIGATSDSALRRVAEYGDGWMPAYATQDAIAEGHERIVRGRGEILRIAGEIGRDMKQVPITAILHGEVTRDDIRRYEDAGVDRLCLMLPYVEQPEDVEGAVAALAKMLP
ncbi:MAG: TIGR03619 family F420-dependent LLM class oxidoreductase [Novosphingobium sp.]|nr:TIGR03619 family F420-dependent LLM class oxidoreductase [Novosphingobium sp.]